MRQLSRIHTAASSSLCVISIVPRFESPCPTIEAEHMHEASVRMFFERYEICFDRSLSGDADMDEVAALYASKETRHHLISRHPP